MSDETFSMCVCVCVCVCVYKTWKTFTFVHKRIIAKNKTKNLCTIFFLLDYFSVMYVLHSEVRKNKNRMNSSCFSESKDRLPRDCGMRWPLACQPAYPQLTLQGQTV